MIAEKKISYDYSYICLNIICIQNITLTESMTLNATIFRAMCK